MIVENAGEVTSLTTESGHIIVATRVVPRESSLSSLILETRAIFI